MSKHIRQTLPKADFEIIGYYPRSFTHPEKSGNKILHTFHMSVESFQIELEAYKYDMLKGEVGHIIIYYNNPPAPEKVITVNDVRAELGKDVEHANI